MDKKEKELFRAYLAWLAVCIIWGTTYLAIRVGVADLPPMLFAGVRWILGGFIFLVLLRLRNIPLPAAREFISIAIPGILMLGITNGLVVVAEQWLPSGLTALLLTTSPFFMFLVETSFPRGPGFNLKVLGGLLLGLVGITLIFYQEMVHLFKGSQPLGLGLLVIAIISWIGGTLYSKYKKNEVHPLMSACWQMLLAGCLQTILGILLGEHKDLAVTPEGLWAFLYLVLIASILGYGSYIYAINKLPVALVSTHSYVNPVIALFLGWLILDERLTGQMLLATGIIIAGILLVKKGNRAV